MSKNGNHAETPAPEKAVEVKAETKYTLGKLKEYSSQIFGVSECTFIGATSKLSEDTEYSVSEIKKAIEEWQKKEAK